MIRHKKIVNKKTYVAFILDKSGSMAHLRDETISTFNEQLQEHRRNGRKGGETSLSLIQFSGNVEETFFNLLVDEISGKLDREEYNPCGSTALYDAIGYTVNKLQRLDEVGDVGFLVVVISDGQENASRKYTGKEIASLRNELEETGRWTFQYIGSDPNAIIEAQKIGLKSFKFDNTKRGWRDLSDAITYSTASYYSARAGGQTCVSNFMELADKDYSDKDGTSDVVNPSTTGADLSGPDINKIDVNDLKQ